MKRILAIALEIIVIILFFVSVAWFASPRSASAIAGSAIENGGGSPTSEQTKRSIVYANAAALPTCNVTYDMRVALAIVGTDPWWYVCADFGAGFVWTVLGPLVMADPIRYQAVSFTAANGTEVVTAAGGNVIATLPACTTMQRIQIQRIDTDITKTLTVNRAGADTIEGDTTLTIWPGSTLNIVCSGSSPWRITDWTDGYSISKAGGAQTAAVGQFNIRITPTGVADVLNLPACANAMIGRTIGVKLLAAAPNTTRVTRAGADTIDVASTTIDLTTQYQYKAFHCASAGAWDTRY